MSGFNTSQVVRTGGQLDVYTVLAAAAACILLAGVVFLALHNTEYSKSAASDSGDPFKIVSDS
jgi:hypothetical protein